MILKIDKKQIDFTLEGEVYLSEIVTKLNEWLASNQLIIEKIYINNEDYSNNDLHIELNDINIIEIETLGFKELNINNITWTKYFFERLTVAIETWDNNILKQVRDEIPFIINHIPTILSLDNVTPEYAYSQKIEEKMKLYNFFDCKEEIVDKTSLNSLFHNIINLLNERLNEYVDPKKELDCSFKLLDEIKNDIEMVSIFMQSGKNDKATKTMSTFTNILHKILRIVNFNMKNKDIIVDNTILDFIQELDDILAELLDGYESQDTVLIGDILEYEISPRLEKLKEILI